MKALSHLLPIFHLYEVVKMMRIHSRNKEQERKLTENSLEMRTGTIAALHIS